MLPPPSPAPWHIRRLQPADAEALCQLRQEALQQAPDAFGLSATDEGERELNSWQEEIRRGHLFGAWSADMLVAFGGYHASPLRKLQHKAHLFGFYVRPGWRRQGLAAAMRNAIEQALAAHVTVLLASATEDNAPVMEMLEGWGFTAYATEPRAMRTPAGDYQTLVYFRRDRAS